MKTKTYVISYVATNGCIILNYCVNAQTRAEAIEDIDAKVILSIVTVE